jgi:hypothetical protein
LGAEWVKAAMEEMLPQGDGSQSFGPEWMGSATVDNDWNGWFPPQKTRILVVSPKFDTEAMDELGERLPPAIQTYLGPHPRKKSSEKKSLYHDRLTAVMV